MLNASTSLLLLAGAGAVNDGFFTLPYAFPQYGAQFGGLNERMLLVQVVAWRVVTGCRLFSYERLRSGGIYGALGADKGRKWPFPFMTYLLADGPTGGFFEGNGGPSRS